MQCPKCHRELAEDEPVYRLLYSDAEGYPRTPHVCAKCCDRRIAAYGGGRDILPSWQPSKLCKSCGRPVFNFAH
jgi:hypothetical protein